MTTTADPRQLPGGIYQMTAEEYHADPVPGGSLSSSGARKLLAPSCPAKFRWEQDHGQAARAAFDFGQAAHMHVLGEGPEIVVVDAPDWRTKPAQQQRAEARERGAVPVLIEEQQRIKAMAAALREHPVARALFDPDRGRPEQTLIWRDRRTGVMRRARLDWLPDPGPGRLIIPDYKTCASAEPEALARAVAKYGYHQQDDWYRAGARALDLADEAAAFVFVCQEKTAPFVVTVFEVDAASRRLGAARNRRAIEIYAECQRTGRWPAYGDDIAYLSLPPYVERADSEEYL
ncbi:PD-(D/E)XK nuclease-like domain-containing protein [Streptomyces sp. V4-01]|uniref:PD-(D/E)XK nuclease-like domain-containing protein n=1 Tax=Actinacidiphila polyblastidii TaxID=3110430 RepID=A0ABU7P560_9ACTN|nr:PD-(D/E)XK nuclease-like domain-containing protein [Streptomyces sp. V4-01]